MLGGTSWIGVKLPSFTPPQSKAAVDPKNKARLDEIRSRAFSVKDELCSASQAIMRGRASGRTFLEFIIFAGIAELGVTE